MILRLIRVLLLLSITLTFSLNAKVVIEDAEDGRTDGWRVVSGVSEDIVNVYDNEINSRVIELIGGGSYKMGATGGERAFNITTDKTISWNMKTEVAFTIYVLVDTTDGLRYLFYVSSPSRGLKHGLLNGIHHGLGESTINGRWRRVTRDLEADLKDAEPNNRVISVNGFIYNGGNNGRLDNITLYTPKEKSYLAVEKEVEDIYTLPINNSQLKILQWRFKGFGEPEVLESRGTIRDIEAFEFRVNVDTVEGKRDLIYTLGEENLGLIEEGKTVHHGLGDDRAIGSVWAGDDPINELGLWQNITRDLDEDIKDFEPNNRVLKVNSFTVKNSGKVKDIKMLSSVDSKLSKKSSSVGGNDTFFSFLFLYIILISLFLFMKKKEYINI